MQLSLFCPGFDDPISLDTTSRKPVDLTTLGMRRGEPSPSSNIAVPRGITKPSTEDGQSELLDRT
jgi:hypothetical protein